MVFREQLEEMYKEMYKEAKEKNTTLGCIPLKLSEPNVYKIFKKCLATGMTKNKLSTKIFFQGLSGIKSTEILFDQEALSENAGVIKYMLGQIKAIHDHGTDPAAAMAADVPYVRLSEATISYTGEHWTTDNQYLYKLLYLGDALGYTSPVVQKHAKLCIHFMDVKPTLSPDDPNFKEWYNSLPVNRS